MTNENQPGHRAKVELVDEKSLPPETKSKRGADLFLTEEEEQILDECWDSLRKDKGITLEGEER